MVLNKETKKKKKKLHIMRVYLSGGTSRSRHWGALANRKADVKKLLHILNPEIEFVHGGKSDYIVIPDDLSAPSETALKTEGQVMKLSAFVRKLKRTSDNVEDFQDALNTKKSKTKAKSKSKSKAKTSRKKRSVTRKSKRS